MIFTSSAPARVCLFGEHQDYLGLKVIPAAIDLRLKFQAVRTEMNYIDVNSQTVNQQARISTKTSTLTKGDLGFRRYLEAGIISLRNKFADIEFPSLKVELTSDIPLESGLSSSAALLVAWINLLVNITKKSVNITELAELAYEAEHDIVGIPCGRMDQYSSAVGSVFSLICTEKPILQKLKKPKGKLIVVNSETPKLTSQVHGKIVSKIEHSVREFEKTINHKLKESNLAELNLNKRKLSHKIFKTLEGVLSIMENTQLAEEELLKQNPDLNLLGELLTAQQHSLREGIGVSIPVLDKIVEIAIKNGALGGKLTGAGLGGCVVLLADEYPEKISEAIIKELNLPLWNVHIDNGTRFSSR